jgi:hypothetical protein
MEDENSVKITAAADFLGYMIQEELFKPGPASGRMLKRVFRKKIDIPDRPEKTKLSDVAEESGPNGAAFPFAVAEAVVHGEP